MPVGDAFCHDFRRPGCGFPGGSVLWCFYKSISIVRRVLMSSHLSWQGINPSRSIRWQRRSRARSNRSSVMPGVFKEWISSGVTEREHAYATSSSIGALSQCECPAGSFLVDLGGETRFAGIAGAAGSGGGGGVPTEAGTTGMPGAGLPGAADASGGGTLVAITPGPPGAVGGGATLPAGTTGLPGDAGDAFLAARRTTRMPAPRTPGAVGGADVPLVAGTTGSLAAAPAGPVEGSAALAPRIGFARAGAPGAAEGTGGTMEIGRASCRERG